ncbi:MAG: hypothetical protein U1F77_07460 [Kiritimatiellia bacterium]
MFFRKLMGVWVLAVAGALVSYGTPDVPAPPAPPAAEDPDALELGRKVLAVQRAIQDPTSPGAMEAVTALGHDQRYYVMVRGWLSQQLAADRSLRDANKERTPKPVLDRIDFLQKAIRAIDLE